jgi:Fic family protein
MGKNRFQKRIKLTPAILNKIAKIDEFKGLWRGSLRLSPQILGRLKQSVIITSTGASTRIEGAKMEDEEVARLLRGLKFRSPKGRDEEENAGYADLLGRIFDNYKTLKLTEGQILQFHSIMLKFSKNDQEHRGKYKTIDNIVVAKNEKGEETVLFRPTPPYLVKKEIDDILFWTQEQLEKDELHPLLVIANFIFEFLAIYPFRDGNGRLSRALTNLLLLKEGYSFVPYISLEEIIEEHQIEYYLALRATQKKHKTKDEDITAWVNFFLDTLIKQTEKTKKIMESEHPEKLLSEKQLKIYELFGKNIILGVAAIDKKLKGKIPKVTIKQALSRLVDLKLVERIGLGRNTRYRRL